MIPNATVAAWSTGAVEKQLEPEAAVKRVLHMGVGWQSALLMRMSGIDTWIHEYMGHALLGAGSTAIGVETHVKVHMFDRFKAIGDVPGIGNKIGAFFQTLWFGASEKGVAGYTNIRYRYEYDPHEHEWHPQRTRFGEALGEAGSDAFLSIAGSVPVHLMSAAALATAVKQKDKNPVLACALMGYGTAAWFQNIVYPFSAVTHLLEGRTASMYPGHDFLNAAERISQISGMSPLAAASLTFGAFAVFPWAVMGATYLHQEAHKTDVVPDEAAILYMLTADPVLVQERNERRNRFVTAYLNSPYRQELERLGQEVSDAHALRAAAAELEGWEEQFNEQMVLLVNDITQRMSAEDLQQAKLEILEHAKPHQPQGLKLKLIEGMAVTGIVVKVAALALAMLSNITASLSALSKVSSILFPVGTAISLITTAYGSYKIITSNHESITQVAKMWAIAELVTTFALETLLVVALFVPGVNGVAVIVYPIGTLLAFVMAYARDREIKEP